jgi:hypothetical protein
MEKDSTLEGLYIWNVSFTFAGLVRSSRGLLMATREDSVSQVDRKARRYLNRNKKEYPDWAITGVELHGIVEA